MKSAWPIEVLPDAEAVACRGAALLAEAARAAVSERGRCVIALSGGSTPARMLRAWAALPNPWTQIHLVQVDERVAPAGHADRNLTHLQSSLLGHVPLPPEHVHAMPVEVDDLAAAAGQYARTLGQLAGEPPVLDLIHLGLGADGHTASLVPEDPVIDIENQDVAITSAYQGRRRMTLTLPALNRARHILWVVTGAEKAAMLDRLIEGDQTIPAGRIRRDLARVLADRAAGGSRAER